MDYWTMFERKSSLLLILSGFISKANSFQNSISYTKLDFLEKK